MIILVIINDNNVSNKLYAYTSITYEKNFATIYGNFKY